MNKGIARRLLSVLLAAIMIAALLPAAGLGENVTEAAQLSITTQPVNATVEVGDTATFTVAATGNGTLSYQWQSRKDASSEWSNSGQSGAKTKTLSVATTAGLHGWQFRCIVKDSSGQKISNAAALTVAPKITTQPTNAYAAAGGIAKFTVAATGKAKLTYQWQSRKDASSAWSNSGQSGAKTATLSVATTAGLHGWQFRCVVTDANGQKTYSDVALVLTKTGILTHPKDTSVTAGSTAKFTVTAAGQGSFTYQWQSRKDASSTWSNSGQSGAKSATLSVATTAGLHGWQFRCVVTDANGQKVYSNAATLTIVPKITKQPADQTVTAGTAATFTVAATGKAKLSYQWQSRKDASSAWTNSGQSGAKTATLSVATTAGLNGWQFRCVVTDGNGQKAYSNGATLTVSAQTTSTSTYMNSKFTKDMPKAVIVLPVSPTSEEVFAAGLLLKYIEEEDGYKPEVIYDNVTQGSRGFEISVGNTKRPHGTAKYSSNDSYSIKSYTNGVSITGVGQLGLMHGAMRFLEAFGGYYYLSWNDLYVTNQKHFKYETSGISIDYERPFLFTDMDICFSSINPASDLTDPYYGKGKPSGYEYPRTGRLFSLAFGLNGFYADTYCLPKTEAGRETWYLTAYPKSQYDYPNTVAGLAAGQVHTLLAEFLPAQTYFADHPEWYAANVWWDSTELRKPDAERQRTEKQLCPYKLLHDPEAYALVLQHCRDMIAKSYDPNAPIQIISVSKNDGSDLCMCSLCMKNRVANGDSSGMHEAIEYIQLVNQLSKDLHKNGAYPNLYIDMLAYEWTVEAPTTFECDDHVIVRYAPIRRCYGDYLDAEGHVTNQKYYQELVNWTKVCKHVWIWDYNSNFWTTAGTYANVDVMQHDIKLYYELGVEGIYLQSNSRHLESNSEFGDIRNYIEGRMLQDPTRDYEQELAFITDALYGSAGRYVREYMKHIEDQAGNHHQLAAHRDDVNMYDRPLYSTFAGVRSWTSGDLTYRMPDSEIGLCQGLWNQINKIKQAEPKAVQDRITRLEFSWRLIKSTLNVYEFSDPSTYKSANTTLISDMKAAGVTYFSAIHGKTINDCVYPQNHPDNWYNSSDNVIGTFTATNPNTTRKPAIPDNLFVYYK
ncbi:MAG: DUF4838 domain-containing protein [Lachnospiraceae bacterium]|nr:DUF4838 domain-containing protein [Lachnospiraceae bacterium]